MTICDRRHLTGNLGSCRGLFLPVAVTTSPLCAGQGHSASSARTVADVARRGSHPPHAPDLDNAARITRVAGTWRVAEPH